MSDVHPGLSRASLRGMGADAQRILESALALSDKERAEIAAKLLDSLDGDPDAGAEAAWVDEITRRAERLEAGESKLVDGAQVRENMLQRFGMK